MNADHSVSVSVRNSEMISLQYHIAGIYKHERREGILWIPGVSWAILSRLEDVHRPVGFPRSDFRRRQPLAPAANADELRRAGAATDGRVIYTRLPTQTFSSLVLWRLPQTLPVINGRQGPLPAGSFTQNIYSGV